jgi:hypothetical protein
MIKCLKIPGLPNGDEFVAGKILAVLKCIYQSQMQKETPVPLIFLDHSASAQFILTSNLSIRMGNRMFTRLTNASSKKIENHSHTLALYFVYYNFCKIHKSLSVTLLRKQA